MSPRLRRLAVPLAAFALGAAALATAAIVTLSPGGREVAAASVGGPFALVDQDGRGVTEKDFLGRPHLVFFGFTHCPDICPTTLSEVADILRATGERGRDLRALFVTVDPERDTPAILKSYIASFDDRIVGLTGTPDAVAAAARAYRVYFRKVPTKDSDYTMEHTTAVYLMDARGRFVSTFRLGRPPAEAAAELLARS